MLFLMSWACAPQVDSDVTVPPLDVPEATSETTSSSTTPTSTSPTTTTPPDPTGTTTDALPSGLHGTVPAVALEPPDFEVYNRDQTIRTPEDLVGQPTILWFYPAAGTLG